MSLSYFDGIRDGLKKNILIRQKCEMRNKIIHYQKLIDIKPSVNNKPNNFKFENLNPLHLILIFNFKILLIKTFK